MPARGPRRRFDRAKTVRPRDERDGGSHRFHTPQQVKRQGEVPPPPAPKSPPQSPPVPPSPLPLPAPPTPSSRAGPSPVSPPGPPSALKPPPGVPDNDFAPGEETSDDEDSGEDDSDDDDGGSTENPFAPASIAASETQLSIFDSADTFNPFTSSLSTDGIGTSNPGVFFPSASTAPQTSTPNDRFYTSTAPQTSSLSDQFSTYTAPQTSTPNDQFSSTAIETRYTPTPTMPPTTSGPSWLSATSSMVPMASETTSMASGAATPEASNHPIAKAAVVVPAVFGSVAAVAALFLLFRYCTPVRARWAIFLAGRGQRLPEEEDAVTQTAGPQMADTYATRTAVGFRNPSSLNPSSDPSSDPSLSRPNTPGASYTRGTAVALPVTTTRVPPPILIRNFSKNLPQNPRAGQPTPARNDGRDSAAVPSSAAVPLGEQETYAFNFNVSDYAAARGSDGYLKRHSRHPSGLENNPPTPVARNVSLASSPEEAEPMPNIASIGSGSGIGMFPLPPSSPSTAHFGPGTPPESVVDYAHQGLRKSITPSESISNVPESPVPPSARLMPPLPNRDSRWSNNSSSEHWRRLA